VTAEEHTELYGIQRCYVTAKRLQTEDGDLIADISWDFCQHGAMRGRGGDGLLGRTHPETTLET
jgi:hypothetical protein